MPQSNQRRGGRRRSGRGIRGGSPGRRGGGPPAPPGGGRNRFGRRITRWVVVGVVAVVAILIIFSFAITAIDPGGTIVNDSGGTGERIGEFHESIGNEHIPSFESYTNYNTTPPTSGPHWDVMGNPRVPVDCGFYDQQLRNERTVHNLEHGHIVVSYNISDADKQQALFDAVRDLPGWNRYVVVQPYAQLPEGEIVMTGWEYLQRFDEVDPEGMKEFYDARRGHGLEGAPGLGIPCL